MADLSDQRIFGRGQHPGFLMLDSPQKNLGQGGVVDRVYAHLGRWLTSAGRGAQIIVADTAPPAVADADVVVRL